MGIRRTPLLFSLLLTLCAAGLAGPGAAPGSVSWVVRGHGFGHGVGMSQYGAYGYALHKKGYRFILRHYYRGTKLGTLQRTRVVRVLVGVIGGDIGFSRANRACGRSLDPEREYEAHRAGRRVVLRNARGRRLADCGSLLRAGGRGRVRISRIGVYRGALEVVPTDSDVGSLNAINAVPVDQYVKGVIANESPASWPQAALRAQAVAARSYALSVQVDGNGFDLYDDTSSQVYEGMRSETTATNRAAGATKGEVLTYDGEIAEAYFSACSGGHTESVENVFFGDSVPYLVGVPDPYDDHCPLHSWTLRFSGPQISARLGGRLEGRLKRIAILKRGSSPRIVWARLYGTGGTTKIRGDRLASALGAYDRWLTFHKVAGGRRGAEGGAGAVEGIGAGSGGAGSNPSGGTAVDIAGGAGAVRAGGARTGGSG